MIFDSDNYWEQRYSDNGNSGDGSYGILADFKADTINQIIKQYRIKSLVDYGVGDGNQYSLIESDKLEYYGIDVSKTAVNLCQTKFVDHKDRFMLVDEFKKLNTTCDLSMSCDVLYHLIENDKYQNYIESLVNFSHKYILIYARDETTKHAPHVYFRAFNDYIQDKYKCKLIKKFLNKYPQKQLGFNNQTTSPSDFFLYIK